MSSRALPAALCVLAWAALWVLPWQGWLASWPWIRLSLSLAMLILPGALLYERVLPGRGVGAIDRVTVGLGLSAGMVGLLGLLASVVHGSISSVATGLALAGAAGIAAVTLGAQRPSSPAVAAERAGLVVTIPGVVAILCAARLAFWPGLNADDYTYLARIGTFLSGERLGFAEQLFGLGHLVPPRFWLSFWELDLALLARNAGLHPVELVSLVVDPFLAALSLLATFALARSLGLPIRLAWLAVVAQATCLVLASRPDQAGLVFFRRLGEDKVAAAFLLAPIFFRLVVGYLALPGWRSAVLLALAAVGLALAHPTIFGMAWAVAMLYGALDAWVRRSTAPVLRLALLLTVVLAAPLSLRLVEHTYAAHLQFSVEAAREARSFTRERARRLALSAGGRRYALSPRMVEGAPFLAILLAAAVGLAWRSNAAARLVVAAGALLGLALIPSVAWLLGLALTPFHLWRIPWLMPFGIAGAVLVLGAVRGLRRWRTATELDASPSTLGVAGIECLLLAIAGAHLAFGATRLSFDVPDGRWTTLHSAPGGDGLAGQPVACQLTYADIEELGGRLRERIVSGAVVAGDPVLNDLLPALAPQAKLIAFRALQPDQTSKLGGLSPREGRQRREDWARLLAPDSSPEVRAMVIDRYAVEYLAVCGMPAWLTGPPAERFDLVERVGTLLVYHVKPGPGTAGTAS